MPRKSLRVALRLLVGAVVVALVLLASPLRSHGWAHVPAVTIVAAPGDPGIAAVQEAVDFWNRAFYPPGRALR